MAQPYKWALDFTPELLSLLLLSHITPTPPPPTHTHNPGLKANVYGKIPAYFIGQTNFDEKQKGGMEDIKPE